MPSESVHIVGGGMTGFTVALRLARKGMKVIVHETERAPGGLSGGSAIAGIPVERFYHCVFPTDESLLALFSELGISDIVGWTRTRVGFLHHGQLLEMTTMRDFLTFPAVSLADRLRLAWTLVYCGYIADWRWLDKESVGPFLRRHGGERLFNVVWEPLLLSKLGPTYNQFAAPYIWAIARRMLRARKSEGRSEKTGYVRGRYATVFAAFRKELETMGGTVYTGHRIEKITRGRGKNSRWGLVIDGTEHEGRGIVLTTPAPIAAPLVAEFAPEASERMRSIEYLGVVCEALLLRRRITPYYVLNLIDRPMPFTGVIEMTALTGVEEFSGNHLVYLPRYCTSDSPLWKTGDEEIHRENLEGLKKVAPDFTEAEIVGWSMNRARFVQPVQFVGRSTQLPPVRLADGLAYLSTAHIYPWNVFNDEAVRNVDANLPTVLSTLSKG